MIWKFALSFILKHWLQAVLIGGVLAILAGAYTTGYRTAWKQAEVETLKARIASQQRDIDAGKLIRKADQDAITRLEAQAMEDEENYEALRCLLEARPDGAGRGLTQSELDLLLGKRAVGQHGGADDQSAGPSGCTEAGGSEAAATR